MLLNPLTFYAPQSLQEATKLYASLSEARILAGGTFLLNSLKLLKRKGLKTPQNIISLRKVEELKGVKFAGDSLSIGSITVINDLFNSAHLTDNLAILRTVCRNISTNPIRNMATIGGNLTSRYTWTELGAPLIALEAMLNFVGPNGEQEQISVEEFFKNGAKATKILSHVSIRRDKTATVSYYRVKKMSDVDVPLLGVCIKTNFIGDRFSKTRVCINNTITFAQRDSVLEEFLEKSEASKNIPQEALEHLNTAIYDNRSDDYKKAMFRVAIKRALADLIGRKK